MLRFYQPTNLGSHCLKTDKNFKMKYQKEPLRVSQHLSLNLECWTLRYKVRAAGLFSNFWSFEYWTFHVCFKLNLKMQAVRADVISCSLMFSCLYFLKFEMFSPIFLLPIRDPALPWCPIESKINGYAAGF